MARIFAVLIGALALASFPGSARSAPPIPASHAARPAARVKVARPVLATLERTACFGSCPIYKVTIYTDGQVEYQGRRFVKHKGIHRATISQAELATLRKVFLDAKYLDLQDHYDCYEVTDASSANTSFHDGARQKAITHYHGCTSAPKALYTVEAAIDAAAHTARWVK